MPDRLITTKRAAAIWRVAPATFRSYVSRGYAPQPVAEGLYVEAEVREFKRERPGAGARVDTWS